MKEILFIFISLRKGVTDGFNAYGQFYKGT
jgi:hypothetical protein